MRVCLCVFFSVSCCRVIHWQFKSNLLEGQWNYSRSIQNRIACFGCALSMYMCYTQQSYTYRTHTRKPVHIQTHCTRVQFMNCQMESGKKEQQKKDSIVQSNCTHHIKLRSHSTLNKHTHTHTASRTPFFVLIYLHICDRVISTCCIHWIRNIWCPTRWFHRRWELVEPADARAPVKRNASCAPETFPESHIRSRYSHFTASESLFWNFVCGYVSLLSSRVRTSVVHYYGSFGWTTNAMPMLSCHFSFVCAWWETGNWKYRSCLLYWHDAILMPVSHWWFRAYFMFVLVVSLVHLFRHCSPNSHSTALFTVRFSQPTIF